MGDRALENAETLQKQLLARKQELHAELVNVEDRLAHVSRFIKSWHLFAEADFSDADRAYIAKVVGEKNESGHTHTEEKVRPRNSRKEEVAEVARQIILERGEPVPRTELHAELVRRGLTIEGTDPEMVLSTMLWRMIRQGAPLVRLRSGGYWLSDRPHEESGYDPATATNLETLLSTPVSEIRSPKEVAQYDLGDDISADNISIGSITANNMGDSRRDDKGEDPAPARVPDPEWD